ncbi:MAG: PEP-utilizing enzyme [Planctomycetes bacterium]|nr:PEP-utilizing enzyme [Planctomycetota bacterium]
MSGAPSCLLIASSRGQRRLDPNASFPNSLRELPGIGRVLDWDLAALREAGVEDVRVVGGYHMEKIVRAWPGLPMFFHARWDAEGDAGALTVAAAALARAPLLVTTDRCVFRPGAVTAVLAAARAAELAVGWIPGEEEGALPEPVLVACGEDGARALREAAAAGPATASLARLVATVVEGGQVAAVDVPLGAEASRVTRRHELARFVLGTKAETLARLAPVLRAARILPQVRFTVADWDAAPAAQLARVAGELGQVSLVVRSAALAEDGLAASRAGAFTSVLGVDGGDPAAVADAIGRVVAAYADRGAADPRNQVLVQPAVGDVRAAGVVLTRKPGDGAPYYVMDLDRSSRTDGVTGGGEREAPVTVLVPRCTPQEAVADPLARRLVACARELEELVGLDALDIEVALAGPGEELVVLQVRPLTTGGSFELADEDLAAELGTARAQIVRALRPRHGLAGGAGLLGNMPDWNPAEILGLAPRPLAFSLYRRAVTDRVWAEARAALGYADARHVPLVVGIAGRPYVQVQASFHSLLPADLDPATAHRVVGAAVARLRARPELHDKVEFEVLPACADFAFERWTEALGPHGASADELRACRLAHARLTGRIVRGEAGPIPGERARLARLEALRREVVGASDVRATPAPPDPWDDLEAARVLLERLGPLGTRPFAVLAREAFVAMSLLRSLVARGALAPDDLDALLAAVPNVAGDLARRLGRVAGGDETLEAFLRHAGHLRPGTYDVLTPTYADAPELYLGPAALPGPVAAADPEVLAAARARLVRARADVARLAAEAGLEVDVDGLWHFVTAAIPAREEAKLEFTRTLSSALDLLGRFADRIDLGREALAHLTIDELLAVAVQGPHAAQVEEWRRIAGLNQKRMQLTRAITLPDLITGPEDVECVVLRQARPNFVTRAKVTAPPAFLDDADDPVEPSGRVVVCRRADPGYDWIFARGVAGLVTQHGGAGSHMAIRAAELGVPAAIGVGELIYARLRGARLVRLDCARERVEALP